MGVNSFVIITWSNTVRYCKYQTDVIVIGYGSSVYVYVVTSEVANPYSLPSTIKNPLRWRPHAHYNGARKQFWAKDTNSKRQIPPLESQFHQSFQQIIEHHDYPHNRTRADTVFQFLRRFPKSMLESQSVCHRIKSSEGLMQGEERFPKPSCHERSPMVRGCISVLSC